MISLGNRVAKYLKKDNCTLRLKVSSFEEFSTKEKFDTVLSFANHSTFDKNTKQSVQDYLKHCHDLLKPSGELLFESHPPEHEGKGLQDVVTIIKDLFIIQETKVSHYGTYLDRNRTFIVANKK